MLLSRFLTKQQTTSFVKTSDAVEVFSENMHQHLTISDYVICVNSADNWTGDSTDNEQLLLGENHKTEPSFLFLKASHYNFQVSFLVSHSIITWE